MLFASFLSSNGASQLDRTSQIRLTAVPSTALATAQKEKWNTYANARFNYSIAYPASLKPQGEAENGDGQAFRSANGETELRVWGSYNALNETLGARYQKTVAELQQRGAVTYKVLGRGWFVVSGTAGGKVIYQKTLLKGDVYKTFTFEYPAADKSLQDAITSRIANSFKG
jgi:hypothetical protein